MNNLKNRLIIMVLIIVVVGVLGILTREAQTLQWMIENENRMRDFVKQYPWQGWLLGFAVYTLFSLVPGTAGKSVVWGWLFGFWPAVAIVDMGLTIAAVVSFLAARFLFREAVKKRFRGLIEKLDHSLDDDGAFYLLMMRIAHVPFSFVNYGAGATSVRVGTFAWTTSLGVLPGTMIFVFVGTRIPTLASLAEKGTWQLLDPLLVSLLAATIVFPVVVRWAVNTYRTHRAGSPELELNDIDLYSEWME